MAAACSARRRVSWQAMPASMSCSHMMGEEGVILGGLEKKAVRKKGKGQRKEERVQHGLG